MSNIKSYKRNQSQINIFGGDRDKSPSNVNARDADEDNPLNRKDYRVNTFDVQLKNKAAKQSRVSPYFRISFANNDKGHDKYDKFKASLRSMNKYYPHLPSQILQVTYI